MSDIHIKNLIYERTETKNEIIIKYNTFTFYLKILLAGIGIWGCIRNYFFIGILSLVAFVAFELWGNRIADPVTLEIKKASKKGRLKVSGKQYSFIRPVIVHIKNNIADYQSYYFFITFYFGNIIAPA